MTHLGYLCTLVVLISLGKNCVGDDLVSVVVVFRHGDRTPYTYVKTDPYNNESYWPAGMGQLTSTGKQQHYALGQWFRKRYDGFLPMKYSEHDIYIRTTDVDRTHMSAASDLAGLYPPEGDQMWNKEIPWQPIPIHSVPDTDDYLLKMTKPCKKYDLLMKDLLVSPKFTKLLSDNSELIEYLSENCGQGMNSSEEVNNLHDTLFVESLYNFSLPEWTKEVYPNKLFPFAVLEFERPTYNPELALLKTGPFFYELVKHFTKFVDDSETVSAPWGKKFTILSAHDDVLANMLNTMEVWDRLLPPYASSLLFEMRQTKEGKKYMNLIYKKSPTDVQTLTLPGCKANCDFEKFAAFLEPKSLSHAEWEKECANTNSINHKKSNNKKSIGQIRRNKLH